MNTADKIISYIATTDGSVNGINFDKIESTGYAYPNQKSYLMSRRFTELPIVEINVDDDIIFYGICKYEIQYRYLGEVAFTRKTSKVIEISSLKSLNDKYSSFEVNEKVITHNHFEE